MATKKEAKANVSSHAAAEIPREDTVVQIAAPDIRVAEFKVTGTRPYVQQKFPYASLMDIAREQSMSAAQKKKARTDKKGKPKNFDNEAQDSSFVDKDGRRGIPCSQFRNAMISACRLTNYKMTLAKQAIIDVEPDTYDAEKGDALVLVMSGEWKVDIRGVRSPNGKPDIRARMMLMPGWTARVRVRYDASNLTLQDMVNLFQRAGAQCGIGAGRPTSTDSNGLGWGLFDIMKGE